MKKSLVLMLAVILVALQDADRAAAKLPRMQFYTMHADRNPT